MGTGVLDVTYHLGVDLGTTYTAAAMARDGRAQPATLGARSVAVPSVVYLAGDELLVGEAAARRAVSEPGRVAREFKRRVGDPTPILLGGSPIGAELLMARMLRWVVGQVSATEGGAPASVAVTHPANWGEYKLDLLRQAIRHVGVDVDHYVPEPAAAASFYATQRDLQPGSHVAVYDLGGGTFDAAVVKREGNSFRIVGRPDGIERLGGIDFDHAIVNYVADNLGIDLDYPPPADHDDPATLAGVVKLRHDCVDAKEALSAETDVSIPVLLPNRHTEVRLTRPEFEAMIRPAINETIVALRRAVDSAGIGLEQVAAVLLVGGSSRIPMVGHMVSTQLGRPVAVDANPKDAISLGAALLAWRAARPAPPTARPAPPADTRPAPPVVVPLAAVAAPQAPRPAPPTPSPAMTPAASYQPRPAAPQQPTSGPYGVAMGSGGPGGPPNPQNRTWLIAGIAAVVALLAVAILATRGGGDDDPTEATDDPSDQTTDDSTDDSTDDTTDDTEPDLSGDLTSFGSFEPLPGEDWGDEAQAQFKSDCEAVFGQTAEDMGVELDEAGICGCMYDKVAASGVSLADFNTMWAGEDMDTSSEAFQAFNTASSECAIEGLPTGG